MANDFTADTAKLAKTRLLSLDVMRGATIAAMILVNNPGDWSHVYTPLDHSEWNGCTPTDLVFPFFLFMVGVSIVFAMETKKLDVSAHGKIIWGAFKRMVYILLIAWGISLYFHHTGPAEVKGFWNNLTYVLGHIRIPGVLQRIAVVFFISSVLYVKTSQKFRDWFFAVALIGYFIIMYTIPVPGVGYANIEPETNLGAWLDRLVFGTNHLWKESKVWDPEGLLGTLPAIGTCLFGIRAGSWLKRTDVESGTKVSWLFVYGIIAVLVALFWNFFFPINKKLWSSSFVLYAGGLATIALAFSYWMIDVQNRKKGVWVFVVFGMNSIMAYIVGDIIGGLIDYIPIGGMGGMSFIYKRLIAPFFNPYNASLVRAIVYVILSWLPMLWLYKKKIYIRV